MPKILSREDLPPGTKVKYTGGRGKISINPCSVSGWIWVRDERSGAERLKQISDLKLDNTIEKAILHMRKKSKKGKAIKI